MIRSMLGEGMVETYGYNELKEYVSEDFEEFTQKYNYSVEQASARILDEYIRAIRNKEVQKVTIYVTIALLGINNKVLPAFIYDEVIIMVEEANIGKYQHEISPDEVEDFMNDIQELKRFLA